MTIASPQASPRLRPSEKTSDWRLFLKLVPYARNNLKGLGFAISLLIPGALARAIQPIIIGQAVSLLGSEPSTWAFLRNVPTSAGLNLIALMLLLTIVGRLACDSMQGFLVQKSGQRITADIRNDLFSHVTALGVRFFDRTPVGKLITRLTSDVDALGEVFSTGAIGIIGDVVLMIAIAGLMFSKEWKLATLLVLMLVPTALFIVYLQKRYRQANYDAREELSSLNSMLQENILGLGLCSYSVGNPAIVNSFLKRIANILKKLMRRFFMILRYRQH
jgi:ATP-binding cassette, subfamily B, multidrug efflux pump